jgi:hypothetical protein
MGNKIREAPASEPGALDGWVWTCDECGMDLSGSLWGLVYNDLREHQAWHASNPAGEELELTGAELVAEHTGRPICPNCDHAAHDGNRCDGRADGGQSECVCSWPDAGNFARPITVDGFPYTTTAPEREA